MGAYAAHAAVGTCRGNAARRLNYYWRERVRVHVPIVTQPTVRFVCGGEEVNMREGECWIFDTWRMHNVVNDHALPRIHLVADTVGGAGFWQLVPARGRIRARARTGRRVRCIGPAGGGRRSISNRRTCQRS